MKDILDLIIGFLGGVVATFGLGLAFIQYKKSQPSIELLSFNGSGLLSPEAEKDGYTWRFHLSLQNKRNIEYAISDILWTTSKKKYRKKMPQHQNGWQTINFKDVLSRHGTHRNPLMLKPYELREIEGHWKNWWVGNPHSKSADEYWQDNPKESEVFHHVIEDLHNQKIIFKIVFSDGRAIIQKNRKNK